MQRFAFPLLALALVALAGGLLFASCGSDFDTVETAELECTNPCSFNLSPPTEARRNQFASAFVLNSGAIPARITGLRIENSSPYVGFSDSLRGDILRRTLTEDGESWTPTFTGSPEALTGFEANGIDLLVPAAGRLELTVEIRIPRGQSLAAACPDGPGNCGQVVVSTSNSGLGGDGTLRIPIRVGGDAGEIQVFPEELLYTEASARAAQRNEFTIENIGGGALFIDAVRLANEQDNIEIRETSNVPIPTDMGPGATFTFAVTWIPRQDGEVLDNQILIESDDSNRPLITIPMSNSGEGAPGIRLFDTEDGPLTNLDLPDLDADGSAELGFKIRNTGDRQLLFTFSFSGVQPNDAREALRVLDSSGRSIAGAQQSIAPNQSRDYTLRFAPGAGADIRSVNGVLRLGGINVPGLPRVDVPFSAGEAVPLFDVSDSDVRWGVIDDNTPSAQTIHLFNDGRAALEITGLSLGGDNADLFSIDPSGAITIPARSSRPVTITYSRATPPRASDHRAQLTITSADPNRPSASVSLVALRTGDPPFLPPTCSASASPAGPVSVGDEITFDAAGSTSNNATPDLNLADSAWVVTRPGSGRARLATDRGPQTVVIADEPGTWTAWLTIEERGAQSRCSVELTVNP